MDKRLNAILHYLEGFNVLYDVGSDHALLPIAAIKQNKVKRAYAIDNKKNPLKQANKNIAKAGLNGKITPLLADGLAAITSEVDVVVIAGLGGASINDIMKNYHGDHVKRFILAPNTHEHLIRALVNEKPLKIKTERFIEEKGYFYPIMVLEPGQQSLNEEACYISKPLLKAKDETYKKALKHRLKKLEESQANIPIEHQPKPLTTHIDILRRAIDGWQQD